MLWFIENKIRVNLTKGKIMDEWLMGKACSGDLKAFSDLVQRNQEFVIRIAYQFLGTKEDAEDAAQEVFIKLYNNLQNYHSQGKFRGFLAKVTSNECLNRLRKKEKNYRLHQDIVCHRLNPEQQFEQQELGNVLFSSINDLPEKQKLAFLMKIHGNCSYDEISEELQCPKTTIGGLIFRARRNLHQKLGQLFRKKEEHHEM